MDEIDANYAAVQARVAGAAHRAGRHPADVTLVAVSKAQPFERLAALYAAGHRDFGENRIPAASAVVARANAALDPQRQIRWHFIGHIQSRKAGDVAADFSVLHAVDSLHLAEKLNREAEALGRTLTVMVQCNVSGEASKFGVAADRWHNDPAQFAQVRALVLAIDALPRLRLVGLMTMAPIVPEPEQARPVFVSLRGLRDALCEAGPHLTLTELSMGMTDDFEVAIEEGATIVRVGRALFGERLSN